MYTNFAGGNSVDLNPFITGVNNGGYSVTVGSTIRQVIDPAGNVGFGTSTPGYRLDVNGNINFVGTVHVSGRANYFTTEGSPSNGQNRMAVALYSYGNRVYTDERFASGQNSLSVYDNNGSGQTTITRISSAGFAAPNNSGFILQIRHAGSGQTPGFGGIFFAIGTRANATLAFIMKARIPTGYALNFASNPFGSNATSYWVTDNVGTGKWEDYVYVVRCGDTGTFSSTHFYFLTGSPTPTAGSPLLWYISSATVRDVDDRV
jgi:hypothetical protein